MLTDALWRYADALVGVDRLSLARECLGRALAVDPACKEARQLQRRCSVYLLCLYKSTNTDAEDLTLRVAEVPEGRDLLADIGEQVQRGASLPEDAGTGGLC